MNTMIKTYRLTRLMPLLKISILRHKMKIKMIQITSDELLLFRSKILQAIDYIREKRKRPDTNAIYEYLKKTETLNIDQEAICNIFSE